MFIHHAYLILKHIIFTRISGDHKQKFYWGHKEILVPVYKNMADAMKKHPEVDVLISFASLRSAYDSTIETMQYPQVWDQHQLTLYVHLTLQCCELVLKCLQISVVWLFVCLLYMQVHTIAIIAEGIPEALTRKIIRMAEEKGVTIIGPATVWLQTAFLLDNCVCSCVCTWRTNCLEKCHFLCLFASLSWAAWCIPNCKSLWIKE